MITYHRYNDGLCPGGRRPRLYLAKGDRIARFEGANIDGFCALSAEQFQKNGKWSNTTYTLALAPGVRAIEFLSPLHGTWGDKFGSWGEVCESLSLPVDVAQTIVRAEYPKTAERLDALEKFAVEAEVQGNTTETVIVSFGSPTNRQIRDGWWDQPKSGRTGDGRTVSVKPSPDWDHPEVVEPSGAKIVAVSRKPGMHGGYVKIEVAVPVKES